MPRCARLACDHQFVHVLNRRVDRRTLFESAHDYSVFASILAWGQCEVDMRITAWCLMPNHWHLIVQPRTAAQLSAFMHRVETTHAIALRRSTSTRGEGSVYGNRFKGFIIPPDRLLRSVVYVERNPVKAGLVARSQEWAFGSSAPSAAGVARPRVRRLPPELERHRVRLLDRPLPEEFERAFVKACRNGSVLESTEDPRADTSLRRALAAVDALRRRVGGVCRVA